MDQNEETIEAYKQQLIQINAAIANSTSQNEINSLISLKTDIQQLLSLTDDNNENQPDLEDEYATFMAEMVKEGAYKKSKDVEDEPVVNKDNFKELEGMKCKAPHKHTWGETTYHNAMICSVIQDDDLKLKVLYLNPTHLEMLPCPYFLDTECKFTEDKCRYSHGEIVLYSEIKEYQEPNFDGICVKTKVLAKKADKLWHRGTIEKLYGGKCLVKFDSQGKSIEVELEDIFPLEDETNSSDESDNEDDFTNDNDVEDVINMSLMINPAQQALGDWEKYTKGIGTKLMGKMGYITGTGLGKHSNGRLEPVSAVILPPGKSLDHCMLLREKAGGDKDLFSVERKLKRQQRKQELRNQKIYENEKNKVDIFDFLNDQLTLTKETGTSEKSKHRDEIKGETSRGLNVASMKIEEEIKRIERELFKIKDSLKRHAVGSQVYKSLKMKQHNCLHQIKVLEDKIRNIKCEQSARSDRKKLTVF